MAKKTPDKPDDVKGAEQTALSGPDTPAPNQEQDTPATVIDLNQVRQEQEAPDTSRQVGTTPPGPADQEAAPSDLDSLAVWEMTSEQIKQRDQEQKKTDKAARDARKAAREAKKKAGAEKPAADDPEMAKKKAELEKELREKYNIPKSDKPVEPYVIPASETTVRIPHDKLHPFKNHPFEINKDTAKWHAFVASIKELGQTTPDVVRPMAGKKGHYEIVSGHRRNEGNKDAGIPDTSCIIRPLNDDQAIQQMVLDNVNNREIGKMELARALKIQLDNMKHQGAKQAIESGDLTDSANIDKLSVEIVAELNGLSPRNVYRYISLNNLTPEMQEYVDGKIVADSGGKDKIMKMGFTTAVEISALSPKNQESLAVAIEGEQSTPSLSQAQRMRDMEKKGTLNGDVIDAIMTEQKKEVSNVIISGAELGKYFGEDKTPAQMKEKILELLDKEFKPKEHETAKTEPEK